MKVGDPLYAVTNPLGVLKNTLSSGIVSGIREMDGYRVFQMTTAISPGSSGGPVLNGASEVIGIAASIIEAGQGLNFSIPIDYAKGIIASPGLPRPISSVTKTEDVAENVASAKAVPEGTPPNLQVLETKLYKWTQQDAIAVFGEPTARQPSYDSTTRKVTGEILTFPDKTRAVLNYNLTFGNSDGLMKSAVAFPLNMKWDDVKKFVSGQYNVIKQRDGSRIHAYVDKRLMVLVKDDKVVSIGVY